MSLIGNPVKFGDGPAAVIGDEHRIFATVCFKYGWEGAASPVEYFQKKFYSMGK